MNRNDEIARLWMQGHSATEIAKMLSLRSRNIPIGVVHRMGLHRTPSPKPEKPPKPRMSARPKDRRRERQIVPAEPPKSIPLPVKSASAMWDEGVDIFHLTSQTCRWPLGPIFAPAVKYCGAIPLEDKAYCAEHCARAFMQPGQRFSLVPEA